MSISVRGLVKVYGTNRVVDRISFEVAKGEFVSLLGPSGCGKTTTLRCIAGLEEANGGEIAIAGEVVSAPERGAMVPPNARDVGMVFQSYAVWPHMTVAENVAFPLTIRGQKGQEAAKQVDWALGVVGMTKLKDRQPSQLSGGQQQRVALARAIVGKPRVLLFDEPLSNLDAKLRDATRSEIKRLQKDLNVAALYVTHDQIEALSMSDRVIVMDQGRIMQMGTPKDLYRRPVNRFVADFVGVANIFPLAAGEEGTWRMPDGTPVRAEGPPASMSLKMLGMLRPEAVRLLRTANAPAEKGLNVLPGKIQEHHYLGAYTEYHVACAGTVLKVHAVEDINAGTDVAVVFKPTDVRLIIAG